MYFYSLYRKLIPLWKAWYETTVSMVVAVALVMAIPPDSMAPSKRVQWVEDAAMAAEMAVVMEEVAVAMDSGVIMVVATDTVAATVVVAMAMVVAIAVVVAATPDIRVLIKHKHTSTTKLVYKKLILN